MNKNLTRKIVYLIMAVWALALFSGGFLIYEKKVEPGENYVEEHWGNLGGGQGSVLCKYFNGRGIETTVYWYSPSNIFGRSSCPFIIEN